MPFPLSLCQRHPRYAVLLAVFLFATFVLLSPDDAFSRTARFPASLAADRDLPARVARAEVAYQGVLDRRKDMVKRFGPTPDRIVKFPPNKEPWPAYTVWDFFPAVFNCPHEVERIGTLGDGGQWVCGPSRLADKPDCVIYSFGLDWTSSFEGEMLARTRHCEVWGYDYVVPGFGGAVPRGLRARTHFARLGLGAQDSHGPADEPKMWTLRSLMRANGHTHIDILHVDIEGWEFEVMRSMVNDFIGLPAGSGTSEGADADADAEAAALPFGQLLIEMHIWQQHFAEFLAFWEMLEAVGLRPFRSEVNLVYANYNRQSGTELATYSFLNTRGDNVFITDGVKAAEGAAEVERDADADEPDVRMIRHATVAAGI